MIKYNYLKLKVKGCRKIEHFKSLGYEITGDYFEVKVKDLNIGSREIVEVICDFCEKEVFIAYREYIRNISIGDKYACCMICGSKKAKETNIKNIGVSSHMMLPEVQEKTKKTNLSKYGVEYIQQSSLFRDKSKNTLIEKYGADHITKTDYFKNLLSFKKIEKIKNKIDSKSNIDNISKISKPDIVKLTNEEINENRRRTNLEKYGSISPFGNKEIRDKSKQTLIDRWGVDSPLKSDEIKEKFKNTMLDRWGVDNPLKSDDIVKSIKENNLKKYNTQYSILSDQVRNKIKMTNIRIYGSEFPISTDIIKEKIKKKLINNYGVDNPFKSDEIVKNIKENNLKKYNTEYYINSIDFRNKSNITLIEKYGTKSIFKNEKYRRENMIIGKHVNYISYLGENNSLFSCDLNFNHVFIISGDNFFHRMRSNIPLCTVCNPIGDQKSIKEKQLYEFIKSIYPGEVIQSYRNGLEIDIYLPNLKLGFEFNGLYFHSEKFKENNYHLNKTKHFGERGIRIIHIWEDNWSFSREIIESQIKSWLGLTSNKIYARKCEVREISDSKLARKFLDDNHIQGFTSSSIKIGLYYENELVSLMVFDQYEGRNKMGLGGWNLSRFCNKRNIVVIGGFSKLLDFFIKKWKPNRVISYADRDWSVGDVYEKFGFININDSEPDYKYIVNNRRIHKSRFKKDNLKLEDKSLITESKYMDDLNIQRIWDCGKIKFELNFEKD